VALLGAILQRREFFHYAQYGELLNNAFSPLTYKAQVAMQDLLLRAGSPRRSCSQGKISAGPLGQPQAAVGGLPMLSYCRPGHHHRILPALLIPEPARLPEPGPDTAE